MEVINSFCHNTDELKFKFQVLNLNYNSWFIFRNIMFAIVVVLLL